MNHTSRQGYTQIDEENPSHEVKIRKLSSPSTTRSRNMSKPDLFRLMLKSQQQDQKKNVFLGASSSMMQKLKEYIVNEWNGGVLQPFVYWLIWMLVGTLVYAHVNFEGNYALGFYFSVNVGYSIGWGDLLDQNDTSRLFSVFYLLIGAIFVSRWLAYLIEHALNEQENVYEKYLLEKYLHKYNPFSHIALLSNIYVYVTMNAAALLTIYLWLIYILVGTLWSCYAVDWDGVKGVYFAVSSMSTGGLQSIPLDSSDMDYVLVGIFSATGVPLMGMAVANLATLLIDVKLDRFVKMFEESLQRKVENDESNSSVHAPFHPTQEEEHSFTDESAMRSENEDGGEDTQSDTSSTRSVMMNTWKKLVHSTTELAHSTPTKRPSRTATTTTPTRHRDLLTLKQSDIDILTFLRKRNHHHHGKQRRKSATKRPSSTTHIPSPAGLTTTNTLPGITPTMPCVPPQQQIVNVHPAATAAAITSPLTTLIKENDCHYWSHHPLPPIPVPEAGDTTTASEACPPPTAPTTATSTSPTRLTSSLSICSVDSTIPYHVVEDSSTSIHDHHTTATTTTNIGEDRMTTSGRNTSSSSALTIHRNEYILLQLLQKKLITLNTLISIDMEFDHYAAITSQEHEDTAPTGIGIGIDEKKRVKVIR